MLFYHLSTQTELFLGLLSLLIHVRVLQVVLLTGCSLGSENCIGQTEMDIRASVFSNGLRALVSIINCRSLEEWLLGFPDNAAGPLRWLRTSSLLFQYVGIAAEGRPLPALVDNHVQHWLVQFPIRGTMNELYMC